jgi:hypothetical protein
MQDVSTVRIQPEGGKGAKDVPTPGSDAPGLDALNA